MCIIQVFTQMPSRIQTIQVEKIELDHNDRTKMRTRGRVTMSPCRPSVGRKRSKSLVPVKAGSRYLTYPLQVDICIEGLLRSIFIKSVNSFPLCREASYTARQHRAKLRSRLFELRVPSPCAQLSSNDMRLQAIPQRTAEMTPGIWNNKISPAM